MSATAPFERLLLALGASGGPASLEFSASIAALLQIPMEALFIEDEELLGMAALPVAREVSRLGVTLPGFDLSRLERDLRRQAVRLERLARDFLARGGIEGRFKVVRGRTAVALAGALQPGDLLVLSRELGPLMGPGGIGSTVRASMSTAWSALLLPDSVAPIIPGPVTTWFDRSPSSEQALRLAERLSAGQGGRLRIILPSIEDASAAGLLLRAAGPRTAGRLDFSRLAPGEDPLERIAAIRSGLLVLPAPALGLDGPRLDRLLLRIRTPLLLFRSAGESLAQ
jgi:hypothetical protein